MNVEDLTRDEIKQHLDLIVRHGIIRRWRMDQFGTYWIEPLDENAAIQELYLPEIKHYVGIARCLDIKPQPHKNFGRAGGELS